MNFFGIQYSKIKWGLLWAVTVLSLRDPVGCGIIIIIIRPFGGIKALFWFTKFYSNRTFLQGNNAFNYSTNYQFPLKFLWLTFMHHIQSVLKWWLDVSSSISQILLKGKARHSDKSVSFNVKTGVKAKASSVV